MTTLFLDKEYQEWYERSEIEKYLKMLDNPRLRKIATFKLRCLGIIGDEKNYGANQGVEKGQIDF